MRLKLDENLGRSVLRLFEEAGHDVTTVSNQHLNGAPDMELLELCGREERCLVSLDLDFSNPILFRPSDYAGIAVLRLPRKPGYSDLLDATHTLIGGLARRAIIGRLWVIQRGRIREHQQESAERQEQE
jgi:Domain of unknown function (DUF5615)